MNPATPFGQHGCLPIWTDKPGASISPSGGGPDNAIARWDGTASLQGSTWIMTDSGFVTVPVGISISDGTNFNGISFGAGLLINQGGVARASFGALALQLGVSGVYGLALRDSAATVLSGLHSNAAAQLTLGGTGVGSRPSAILIDANNLQIQPLGTPYAIFTGNVTQLTKSVRWRTGPGNIVWSAETLAGTRTIATTNEAEFLLFDPGGADRLVNFTIAAAPGNWIAELENTGDANELLNVQTPAAVHITDLRPGAQVALITDATTARAIGRGLACYGGLRAVANATSQTAAAANGYTKVNQWTAASGVGQDVAEDPTTNDELIPARNAIYRVGFAVTVVDGCTPNFVEFTIFVNGVASVVTASATDITGGLPHTIAASDFLFLPAAATVDLRFRSASSGSAVLVQDGTLTIEKVT